MSQRAVDDSVRMISFGGMTLLVSAGAGIVMVASDFADPTVIGMICAAPAALAIPILAVARLMRAARPEPETHIHHNGPVHIDQRDQSSHTRGIWAKTVHREGD